MTNSEKALVYLDGLANLEYKHKRAIIDLYEDISDIFVNPSIAIDYLTKNTKSSYLNTFIKGFENKIYDNIISEITNSDVTVLTENSENYPKSLLSIDFRPICLYCKGNVSLLNSKNIFSIVGARKTLPEYNKLTQNFSSELASSGVVIVTGVADGGDKSAILGSLDSGNTICVLAGGFNYIDSERNKDLISKVAKNGLVITEYPPNVPTLAYHYPVRNRIIAGLSQGVLIVSGSNTSGTRHTVEYALSYGKEIFAFPYSLGVPSGELCNKLIKDGAYLTDSVKDICEVLGYSVNKSNNLTDLSQLEQIVFNEIKNGSVIVDDIIEHTNLKVYEVVPLLTTLELKGYIVKCSNNEYRILIRR